MTGLIQKSNCLILPGCFLKCYNFKQNFVFVDTRTDGLIYDTVFGMQVKYKLRATEKRKTRLYIENKEE